MKYSKLGQQSDSEDKSVAAVERMTNGASSSHDVITSADETDIQQQ